MTDRKTQRRKILDRIRALMAMTIENGCTEAEAANATSRVRALMDEYDVTFTDVELGESAFTQYKHKVEDIVSERIGKVVQAIAKLTGTRAWRDASGAAITTFSFFGREDDVEVARYILAIAERAIRSELAILDGDIAFYRPPVRRRRRTAFVDGMAESLAERISEILWARRKEASGNSNARDLTIVKFNLVDVELSRRGVTFSTARSRNAYRADPEHLAGRARGSQIAFNPGVDGHAAPKGRIEAHRE